MKIDISKPVIYEGRKYFVNTIREKIGQGLCLRSSSEQTDEMYAEIWPYKFVKISELEQL